MATVLLLLLLLLAVLLQPQWLNYCPVTLETHREPVILAVGPHRAMDRSIVSRSTVVSPATENLAILGWPIFFISFFFFLAFRIQTLSIFFLFWETFFSLFFIDPLLKVNLKTISFWFASYFFFFLPILFIFLSAAFVV